MDAKLIVNGKEFDIVINDPELIQMVTKTEEKNGYERVGIGDIYYYTDIDGTVGEHIEDFDSLDKDQHNAANYYNDRKIAEDAARAETLMRRLKRRATYNSRIDWTKPFQNKFWIIYDYRIAQLRVLQDSQTRPVGTVVFTDENKAKEAIELYKEDLIWYFTEYKDRL
jgi:hypothetical protein